MKASGVVFQTNEQQHFFCDKVQKKSFVIPNPIKGGLPLRYGKLINNEIVTFCRLEKEKNLQLLIEAFSILCIRHPEFCLKIWGKGSEANYLQNIIYEKKLQDKVQLMGYSDNIHMEIKQAYMYVNSSNHEGISNAMLESMAIGLPVVCTDCPCGGASMAIENNINGILVAMNDVYGMAEAMEKLISDHDFANYISENAKSIRSRFDQKTIVGEWKKVIEELIMRGKL